MNAGALSHLEGFTPIADILLTEFSLYDALAYAIVSRFCRLDAGVCKASLETMANRTGMHRETLRRHIAHMCSEGYLTDTTPNRRNAPHVYVDVGKEKIEILVQQRATVEETGTAESDSGTAESDSGTAESDSGTAESGMKRVLKRVPKRDLKRTGGFHSWRSAEEN